MSERIDGFTVAFDSEISREQADHIREALLLIRGVVAVKANEVDPGTYIARQQAAHAIRMKVYKALEEK